jgi:hypothetical protein
MSTPLNLSVPLNISHSFKLTDQLSLVADTQSKFKPLSADTGRSMVPSAVTISLKLEF